MLLRSLFVLPVVLLLSLPSNAQDLLQFNGKKLQEENLPPAIRNMLYEIEHEAHAKRKQVLEEALIEMSLEKKAKTKKTTVAKLREELENVKEPTEKEIKDWYEENKKRIPYPFEQIKGQIVGFLKNQKIQERRKAELDKILKEGGKILVEEPEAPVLDINTAGFPSKGKESSKVTVVEFADYQCPHCEQAYKTWQEIWPDYKNKVNFVYIDFPVNPSGISRTVAEGGYCAKEQGKYWEYHNMAFENQKSLSKESPKEFAKKLSLDLKKFEQCLGGEEAKKFVDKAKSEGERVGVQGTPSIFVNGQRVAHGGKEGLVAALDKAIK